MTCAQDSSTAGYSKTELLSKEEQCITSLLDTDLYKLTMQAVVFKHYAGTNAEYHMTNRSKDMQFNDAAITWIKKQILFLGNLRFSSEEIEYLRTTLTQLPPEYFAKLSNFKLDPENEVTVGADGGAGSGKNLEINVKGLWETTILYEVPILAIVSEAYFKFVDTDWDYTDQHEQAKRKAIELAEAECKFSEFGTRRRRSKKSQRIVIEGIVDAMNESSQAKKYLIGTSNVYYAKEFGITPIGTVAHELMMGIAAFYKDYKHANKRAMDSWLDTVDNKSAGFALTDTFGTPNFLQYFSKHYSDIYFGVRQDSGDPKEYTQLVGAFYKKAGYKPFSKNIIYSDSLNVDKCKVFKSSAEKAGLNPYFGVGTFFSNDYKVKSRPGKISKPLNIVLKLSKVNGTPCVKLSDNKGKHMGPEHEIAMAKKAVGYVESEVLIDEMSRW